MLWLLHGCHDALIVLHGVATFSDVFPVCVPRVQASERVITRAVGNVDNYFISNAPCGHFMYEYPPALQKARGNFGAKVFFYRAQLIKGNIKLETRLYTDYAWIAR